MHITYPLALFVLLTLPFVASHSSFGIMLMFACDSVIGYGTIRQDVEEGICQVMASMWLKSQILSMSSSDSQQPHCQQDLHLKETRCLP